MYAKLLWTRIPPFHRIKFVESRLCISHLSNLLPREPMSDEVSWGDRSIDPRVDPVVPETP